MPACSVAIRVRTGRPLTHPSLFACGSLKSIGKCPLSSLPGSSVMQGDVGDRAGRKGASSLGFTQHTVSLPPDHRPPGALGFRVSDQQSKLSWLLHLHRPPQGGQSTHLWSFNSYKCVIQKSHSWIFTQMSWKVLSTPKPAQGC